MLVTVKAFEHAAVHRITYQIIPCRTGIAECYADLGKAFAELSWKAGLTLYRMMRDIWRWQISNPNGSQ